MITDDLVAARTALEGAARDFHPSACSGDDAVRVVEVVGAILKLADGILGKAAKRVEDTAAHVHERDRSAPELAQRLTGRTTGEMRRAIDVAAKLEALPATDTAVRSGRLSTRTAGLIVTVAADDPEVEERLLAAAAQGDRVLRDVGIAALAAREDQHERSARQHAQRSFRMWTAADGMVEGRFRVTPEAGGAIKAKIEDGTRRAFRKARHAKAPESQDAYAADAFVEAVLGDPAAPRKGGFTIHVVIDHEALVRGNALLGERCEIPGVGPVSAVGPRSPGRRVRDRDRHEGQGHHDRRPPRPPHPRRAADGAARERAGVLGSGLHGPRIPRDRPLRGGPRTGRADRMVEPHLAVLDPPHAQDTGLGPRAARSVHRQATARSARGADADRRAA